MTLFDGSNVEDIRRMINEADEVRSQAEYDIDYCEKRQSDILHELEFVKMGYHERAKLAGELIEVRKRRRSAKNQMFLIEPFIEWKENNKRAVNELSMALGKMRKIAEKQNSMVYHKKLNATEVIEHT